MNNLKYFIGFVLGVQRSGYDSVAAKIRQNFQSGNLKAS